WQRRTRCVTWMWSSSRPTAEWAAGFARSAGTACRSTIRLTEPRLTLVYRLEAVLGEGNGL
ncbi:MAG: hypothetical protein QOJ47_2191, partial [Gaiellales bacterium]|nr:hypothetical protein [Gaiellales bacterium]